MSLTCPLEGRTVVLSSGKTAVDAAPDAIACSPSTEGVLVLAAVDEKERNCRVKERQQQ